MNLVIFGAGASLGSALGSEQPPLVSGLLGELKAFAPSTWGALAPEQEAAITNNFEAGMASILDSASGIGPGFKWEFPLTGPARQWSDLQWDLADFFFRFEHQPSSPYERFLLRVRDSGAIPSLKIVSLNYERLLCFAANAIGIRCHVGRDGSPQDVSLCLPHGASFIMPTSQLKNTAHGGVLIGRGPVELSGAWPFPQLNTNEVSFLRTMEEFQESRRDNLYPPVMSFIEPHKFPPSGGGFIGRHQSIFADWVTNAERIIIVGVSVHPSDRHLWGPLARTSSKILYVAPSCDEFAGWARKHGRTSDQEPLAMKWSQAIDAVCKYIGV